MCPRQRQRFLRWIASRDAGIRKHLAERANAKSHAATEVENIRNVGAGYSLYDIGSVTPKITIVGVEEARILAGEIRIRVRILVEFRLRHEDNSFSTI